MRSKLELELEKAGNEMEKNLDIAADLGKFRQALSALHIDIHSGTLKKIWSRVKDRQGLSTATLDKLALFAGFQSWHDFDETLHGDTDAGINYDDRKEEEGNSQVTVKSKEQK